MNGVRRFLGATTTTSSQQQPDNLSPSLPRVLPLSFSPKSTWLSASSSSASLPQLDASTSSKDSLRQGSLGQSAAISAIDLPLRSSPSHPKSALQSSTNLHALSSPPRALPDTPSSDMSLFDSPNLRRSDPGFQRDLTNLTTRNQLLISLMASEAVIDCREFNILGTDEVEELKKEHQVLSSRLVAMNKKLALESKIRDAALSLSRVNAANKKASKQTSEQLDAANNRLEAAQKEFWKLSDRVNDVYKRLMEHRAGVLSYSLRDLEQKMFDTPQDSGYDSSSATTLMGSVSTFTSPSMSTKSRFDGAHLFAGHADAIVPRPKLSAEAATAELAKVEEKLKEAKDQLTAANKKQADIARELSFMKLKKDEVEATLGMDLQAAEETIAALEKELPRLEEVNVELHRLRQEKGAWERERAHLTELMGQSPAKEEIQAGVSALQLMLQDFGIELASAEPSLSELLGMVAQTVHARLEEYLEAKTQWESAKKNLEDDVRIGSNREEALARELEGVRKERDAFRRSSPSLDPPTKPFGHLRTPSTLSSDDSDFSSSRVTAVLQPLWAILPSPEARATKLGAISNKNFRTGSPTHNSTATVSSLSELDVRALKTLYDTRQQGDRGSSGLPKPGGEPFSIEAFAQRVQALINDDRALIERLIRFAQAHDLLKKNAERAQKLAQEGNSAMETYQRQVKILEERNMTLSAQYASAQDETRLLQDIIERMTTDKHELEGLAGEQADQIRQLAEANNSLSAQTLQLAADAAQAPEMIRKQMEAQLSDLKKELAAAEDELLAMRSSEQSQRIALLDELNTMQTENSNLRAQLRAAKR